MGNIFGFCFKNDSLIEKEGESIAPTYSWDVRQNIDPADYCFDDLVGETKGKPPGSVDGQQFSIENCKDSVLFIFDNVACVTIDDCTNCVIFIGPSKGSVFIRDCEDVKLAVCCQQFRTRDCKKVEVYLHTNTQPVIESSTNMKFGCLQFWYPQLLEQVEKAGISLYNNEWSNIYDFSQVQHGSNFSLMSSEHRFDTYLTSEIITRGSCTTRVSCEPHSSVFPLTVGLRVAQKFDQTVLLAMFMGKEGTSGDIQALLKQIASLDCQMRRSKEVKMNTDTVKRIFGTSSQCEALSKSAKEGKVVGFEVEGDIEHLRSNLPRHDVIKIYLSHDDTGSKDINSFFNYVEMVMATSSAPQDEPEKGSTMKDFVCWS